MLPLPLLTPVSPPGAFPSVLATPQCASPFRPCKGVARAYERMAQTYDKAVFLKLLGNANMGCKGMFKQFKIRSTPSFLFFRNGEGGGGAVGNPVCYWKHLILSLGKIDFVTRYSDLVTQYTDLVTESVSLDGGPLDVHISTVLLLSEAGRPLGMI